MIAQFFSTIKGWLYAIIGVVITGLYALAHIRGNQRDTARREAEIATDEAENATELASTQSELSRAQQEAREDSKNETPITRPKPNTDFNKL